MRTVPMLLALTAILCLGLVVFADEPAPAPPPPITVENVEGRAAIIGGDLPTADDEALEDAKMRAVEQAVGLYVEEETLVQQGLLVDNFVRTRASGYVQDFITTKQPWTDTIGLRRVEITANIRPQVKEGLIKEICSDEALLVAIPEFVGEDPSSEPVVQNEVISRVLDAGFRVKDATQLKNIQERERALKILGGDEKAAAEIGLRFLANIVITGRAEATFVAERPFGQSFTSYTYRGRATVRAVKTDTAEIIFNKDFFGKNVMDLDKAAAAQKALQSVLAPLGDFVVERMREHLGSLKRQVLVEIEGLPDEKALERFKNLVSALRWVEEVAVENFATERSRISLTYAPKTAFLASRLAQDPSYQVLDFSTNRVLCRYQAPPPSPPAETPSAQPPAS